MVTTKGGDWDQLPYSLRHSGKCLDVEGISLANGAPVIQWGYWGGGNQKFRLDPVGDGMYRIMIEHTGKCLDVEGISTAKGRESFSGNTGEGTTRSFAPNPSVTGYYKLVAKHSGRCLDVNGISNADGAQIIQWDYWGAETNSGGSDLTWRVVGDTGLAAALSPPVNSQFNVRASVYGASCWEPHAADVR